MLDLSKLTDAVTAVAGIAAARDEAVKALVVAQADVDALTKTLLAAVNSPAGAVGLVAVAQALAPVAPLAPMPPPPPVDTTTYLPGDPRNPAA